MNRRLRAVFPLLAAGLGFASCDDKDDTPIAASNVASSHLVTCVTPETAANEVEVRFSIPAALSSYTGQVPITFGVPFSQGVLDTDAFIGVYQMQSSSKCELGVQSKVTAVWSDAMGPTGVKWLLVDSIVDMVSGEIAPVFLQYDNGITAVEPIAFDWETGFADEISLFGTPPTDVDESKLGGFRLRLESGGDDLLATPVVEATMYEETEGPVRTVLKETGNYRRDDQRIGQFITRYTLFRDQPFVRIYHTIIWGRDSLDWGVQPEDEEGFDYDDEDIDFLTFDVPGVNATCNSVAIGMKSGSHLTNNPCAAMSVMQQNETTIGLGAPPSSTATGNLAGWLSANVGSSTARDTFVGFRWAAEQFPSSFQFTTFGGGAAEVRLLHPAGASWESLAENGDTAPFSVGSMEGPVGVAKTFELWLWPSGEGGPTPAQKNAFAQGGVVAYADPAFVVKAGLPSPMSACIDDDCTPSGMPDKEKLVERAISNAFDWATRDTAVGAPATGESRFGSLHFGDVFYDIQHLQSFSYTYNQQRYWQSTGTGFPVLPWMLWMRSGDPRYRDFAEANARHVMDVDTNHVTRITAPPNGGGIPQKHKGSQAGYQVVHHGAFPYDVVNHGYATKVSDSEGIALAYFLTGYERAHDVLFERAEMIANEWDTSGTHIHRFLADITPPSFGPLGMPYSHTTTYPYQDGPQGQFRTLGELAVLHEVFGSSLPELEDAGIAYLDKLLDIQALSDDGWLPGGRSAWREHALAAALHAFPDRAKDIHEALARWGAYGGSLEVPGPTGKVGGSQSLIAPVAQFEKTGDDRVLEASQGAVLAQAMTVHDANSAPGAASEWVGSSRKLANFVGPQLRDWLAVLAQRDSGHTFEPDLPAAPYLIRALNTATPSHERFYTVKDIGEELFLPLDFFYEGFDRQEISVETTDPSGASLGSVSYCGQGRQMRFIVDEVGGTDGSASTCSSPAESFVHSVTGSAADMGGVFRFDISQPGEWAPSVRAIGVKEQANKYLSFDGASDHYIEIDSNPRLAGHAKMSVAFRMRTSGTGVQSVFMQPYEYSIYTHSGKIWAIFYYVTDGVNVVPLYTSMDMPSPWTDMQSFVATLDFDEKTGDSRVAICSAPGVCEETIESYPGYELYAPSPGNSFFIGRYLSPQYYFDGDLDDLRILPRVATEQEIADYLDGNGMWTVNAGEFADDGEAFMFDGDLSGVSGASYTINNGTAGTDFAYVSDSTPTRVGRPKRVVQYDGARDNREYDWTGTPGAGESECCYVISSSANCASSAPSFQGGGLVIGQRKGGYDLALCQGRLDNTPALFGFVDQNGEYTTSIEVESATPAEQSCAEPSSSTQGELQRMFLAADVRAERAQLHGLGPLLAQSEEAWFDALACEDNAHVGAFGSTGYLDLPGFSMGNDRSVSFKMKAPHTSGAVTILNKMYEFVAFTYYGQLYVSNYLTGGGGAVAMTTYPADEWITVTTTASLSGGNVTVELYINGELVDETVTSATSFNSSPSFPLTLGAASGGSLHYDGQLDDVWFRDGIASAEDIRNEWFLCSTDTAPSGALAFESFEGCPTGSGDFDVVDRLSGSSSSCPGTSGACVPSP